MVKLLELLTRGLVYQSIRNTTTMVCYGMKLFFPDVRRLITEVYQPLTEPITLYSDSQSAIVLTKDGSYHARTKHIDIRYHVIWFVGLHTVRIMGTAIQLTGSIRA